MKKLLPALLLFALAVAACKKDKPQAAPEATVPTVIPVATPAPVPTLTDLSPSAVSAGMVVTITGTNFGTSTANVTVWFAGAAASTQSVTPTQIKAVVPSLPAATGSVHVTIGNQSATGLTYTSVAPTGVDIRLTTQAQVDTFVVHNQGKQLHLTGSLIIGGIVSPTPDIHDISGLSNITSVAGGVSIIYCPLLTDVSSLNNLISAGSVAVVGTGATTVMMDKLTTTTSLYFGTLLNLSNKALTKISFKSLSTVNGSITLASCPQLSAVDFGALTSVAGTLNLSNTNLANMNSFASLQTAGSLTLSGNTALSDLQGLGHLTTLTSPGMVAQTLTNPSAQFGGLWITGNAKLSSLAGLQNLSGSTVPLINISNNFALNDLCPLRGPIEAVSTLAPFHYQVTTSVYDAYGDFKGVNINNYTLAALTLTSNGNYVTTADALAVVASCK